ncbi:iron ABC transporter substrate-binding protein [Streptomyces ruber]|uniref:Iron ABC transporter substrate-binding protein n=2 Tax=Streptomyces TaxID=1883 RepID=A0A918B9C5_9ACTN|nr:ABC transporter substrate-binding protein [Streptomyces ruber]GGQ48759.1 iron ABC transporter substrate-binding protein [Streptomyces ruber]
MVQSRPSRLFRRRPRPALAVAALTGTAVLLTGCSSGGDGQAEAKGSGEEVTIATNLGEQSVPKAPERVAALDNTSFATLKALGVKPVAVPKGLLPANGFEDWAEDDSIADVGTHREPKFEELNAAEPDLIIGGYRFGDHQDQLAKIADTIDVAPSDDAESGYVESLKTQTETLGKIFGKEEQAADIVEALDTAEQAAVDATDGESVFLGVVTAGKVDNGASRIGRLAEPLNLKNVLGGEGQEDTSVHNDSGLAPETIAQLNPDWMILMDRDAAVAEEGQETTAAKTLVEGQEAWKNTTFREKNQVIYLPADFYVTEGAQAYTNAFQEVADAFEKAAA